MSIGAAIQAALAGFSGFGQGLGQVRERWDVEDQLADQERYRQQQLNRQSSQEAATKQYRADTLANEAERLEIARINAETANARESRLGQVAARENDNPVTEAQEARMERAASALDDMNPEMDDADLDRVARMHGFPGGFDEVAAIMQARGGTRTSAPTPREYASRRQSALSSGYQLPMDMTAGPAAGPALNPPGSLAGPAADTTGMGDVASRLERLRALRSGS